MSDEAFEVSDEDSETIPSINVEMDSAPHFALAELGEQATNQARHGDFYLNPAAFGSFNDETESIDYDALHNWMAQSAPEVPEVSSTEPDIQGWTYIADYTLHPLTPNHSGPFQYFIHARIRHDNRLEFGVFESIIHESDGAYKTALATVEQAGSAASPTTRRIHHGDIRPTLRIAPKEEAEAILMKDGKLIMAACPRSLGVLMNAGQAKIRLVYSGSSSYRLLAYYGHIWTYWGAIIDNVLYMVGIPLYTGNDEGSYAYSIGDSAGRKTVSLPPTLHDLRSSFVGNSNAALNGAFYRAVKMLWGINSSSGFASLNHSVTEFLEAHGDYTSRVTLCRRTVAKIDMSGSEGYTLEQVSHGDIDTALTLYGTEGGVYVTEDGSLSIAEGEDVVNGHMVHGMLYDWGGTSGASGFIPTTTRCTVEGRVRYAAQAFYVANYGPSYLIRAVGPFHPYGYAPEEGEEGYKLLSHHDASVTVPRLPDDDPEDDDPPGNDDDWNGGGGTGGGGTGGGGTGGGGTGGGGSGGVAAEYIGDCGIWVDSSSDARILYVRDDKNGLVGYRYKITIEPSVSVSGTLSCILTAKFSIADGNSYAVDTGETVTMWYYLQGGGATIHVHNLTSSTAQGGVWVRNDHPESVTDFLQEVQCTTSARARFPAQELTSRASVTSCNQSNIIQLVPTGKIRKFTASLPYMGNDGRKRRKRVSGTFTRYKLVLQKSNIKEILKNTIFQQATNAVCVVTPPSITGTAGGTAGAPTVTSEGATLAPASSTLKGETTVKGSFQMKVSGVFGAINATYKLGNSCTGWYEETPSNRYTANISGTFTVTSEAKSF